METHHTMCRRYIFRSLCIHYCTSLISNRSNLLSNRPAAQRLDDTICQDGRRLILGWVSENELGERSKVVSLHSSRCRLGNQLNDVAECGSFGHRSMEFYHVTRCRFSGCQRRITQKWCTKSRTTQALGSSSTSASCCRCGLGRGVPHTYH